MRALFLLWLIIIVSLACHAQNDFRVVKDLAADWKVFENGGLRDFSKRNRSIVKTIYIEFDPGLYQKGERLRIEAAVEFSLYLNYQLLTHQVTRVDISIDSLLRQFEAPWQFGIYQKNGLPWLHTSVVSNQIKPSSLDNPLRITDPFSDFSVIVSIFLIIFLVVLLRTNPRLTWDYFNFVRLFSIQEREDTLLSSRISSSVNILFYVFCSLLVGFILLTLFHFGAERIPIAAHFTIHSLGEGFIQWLKLSLYVSVLLLLRLILLFVLTRLFNAGEALGLQFYNFVRLSFFILALLALVCMIYFMFKIKAPEYYEFLLAGIDFLLIFWIIIIGLKLLSRTSFRFFHLFSYLCASEIIPIVILVKVLNS